MKRISVLAALAALAVAGCGSQEAGSLGPAPSPSPSAPPSPARASPPPEPAPAASARSSSFQVWFAKGGKLFVVTRSGPQTVAVARRALDALSGGPSSAERAAGVTSEVPAGSALRVTAVNDGVATVAVDPAFRRAGAVSAPDPTELELRRAQVVFTLTQYATIRRVRFDDGGPTVGRRDFEELLPQIVVDSPAIGARVSSPVTVSGTANVFEATVSMRVLDAAGRELARAFTTATCGTGCRGTYSRTIRYSVPYEQRGTIEVYESSAEDGSPLHLVRIPVILQP
jgi:immunoglobulin-like protein involved in spore germination/sporulation and spore germination protein